MQAVHADGEQECIAHLGDKCLGQHTRIMTVGYRVGHGHESRPLGAVRKSREQLFDGLGAFEHATRGHHLVERREHVAHRSTALLHRVGD
jgi:hypothetical protein